MLSPLKTDEKNKSLLRLITTLSRGVGRAGQQNEEGF
jgi:hypothetical protein